MAIIIFLIFINGILAMVEIAVVTSKKYRLERLAKDGNQNAKTALELSNNPTMFLSTIQVGITMVGILAGAFGESSITTQIAGFFVLFGIPYSGAIARAVVVLVVGCGFLIFGELVPKRIALHAPETIAVNLAPFMRMILYVSSPAVRFLSKSTDMVLRLFYIGKAQNTTITEEEVHMLIREGARTGVIELSERDIVERTLKLGDKRVHAMMTPAKEVVYMKKDAGKKDIVELMMQHPFSYFPVCEKSINNIIGIVRSKTVMMHLACGSKQALKKSLLKPLVIHEAMPALKALEMFKKSELHAALVVDEYGAIQGLITLTDILEAIVGDIPSHAEADESDVIEREDGSFLVNGLMNIDEFLERFHITQKPFDTKSDIHTLGGFIVSKLDKIPVSGDSFEWESLRFEVVDMDGSRVDKVLVSVRS